jgi:AraC-like DNA-binding protein
MLDSLLKIIFLKLLRYFVESKKVSGPIPGVGTSKIVSRATEALSADFQRQWSTDELAKEVGCSRNTLLSHFKKSVGMGPMEFSNYLRILRAQFILTSNPDVRVKNLAEMFGYQSDENFLFNFKKFTKMTPKDFKKSSI